MNGNLSHSGKSMPSHPGNSAVEADTSAMAGSKRAGSSGTGYEAPTVVVGVRGCTASADDGASGSGREGIAVPCCDWEELLFLRLFKLKSLLTYFLFGGGFSRRRWRCSSIAFRRRLRISK